MPDHFFIIGAQRSGTTYLRALLDAHPEIEMARPVRPEPKHFLSSGWSVEPEEYRAQWFSAGSSCPVLGEKTTSYLERPESIDRIRTVFPDALVVVSLRCPVERAISNYRFTVQHGLEDLPPEEALSVEGQRRDWDRDRLSTSPYRYLDRGRYDRLLPPWIEAFGRDRVHLVVFEDLVAEPGVIDDTYAFLGVQPGFRAEVAAAEQNAIDVSLRGEVGERLRRDLMTAFRETIDFVERELGRDLARWCSDDVPPRGRP